MVTGMVITKCPVIVSSDDPYYYYRHMYYTYVCTCTYMQQLDIFHAYVCYVKIIQIYYTHFKQTETESIYYYLTSFRMFTTVFARSTVNGPQYGLSCLTRKTKCSSSNHSRGVRLLESTYAQTIVSTLKLTLSGKCNISKTSEIGVCLK